jgi:hypothetical protein
VGWDRRGRGHSPQKHPQIRSARDPAEWENERFRRRSRQGIRWEGGGNYKAIPRSTPLLVHSSLRRMLYFTPPATVCTLQLPVAVLVIFAACVCLSCSVVSCVFANTPAAEVHPSCAVNTLRRCSHPPALFTPSGAVHTSLRSAASSGMVSRSSGTSTITIHSPSCIGSALGVRQSEQVQKR